ncbi:EamA family transporter [Streptomyces sp. TRM68367]|uniref:EamA family transporter n=1 Tax=Streptomyces sp. TRM68367 TaxID=2758415 RepID=UPI0021D03573|nr:EamA family transporter [Streptomyces sp. TRM68367]
MLSGAGTGIGVAFLYRALAKGAMSIVVPVSDVTTVALPVLAGLALLGERPTALALVGIAAAFPALWLVSRGPESVRPPGPAGGRRSSAVADALVAGVGFAVQFLAMARVPEGTGLWPVAASRVASVVLISGLLAGQGAPWGLRSRQAAAAAGAGALGTLAILLYLAATRQQLVAVANVLAALYPAVPVLLAMVFLRERTTAARTLGLLRAAAAIALIALA